MVLILIAGATSNLRTRHSTTRTRHGRRIFSLGRLAADCDDSQVNFSATWKQQTRHGAHQQNCAQQAKAKKGISQQFVLDLAQALVERVVVKVISPYGEIPRSEFSRLSNEKMRRLMTEVVDKLYRVFRNLDNKEFI